MVNGTYLFLAMATAVRILIKMIIFITHGWCIIEKTLFFQLMQTKKSSAEILIEYKRRFSLDFRYGMLEYISDREIHSSL